MKTRYGKDAERHMSSLRVQGALARPRASDPPFDGPFQRRFRSSRLSAVCLYGEEEEKEDEEEEEKEEEEEEQDNVEHVVL